MARRLATIARWINKNLPELEAVIERDYVNTDRKLAGTRFVHRGKGRRGNKIIVYKRRNRAPLFSHSAAGTYRSNAEVERWLTEYRERRAEERR